MPLKLTSPAADRVDTLCQLLLEVAGRDATRYQAVKRHANVLAAALPLMSKQQSTIARERIQRYETKWGSLLPGTGNDDDIGSIPPELRVAQWLSKRRNPDRYLQVAYQAACSIGWGETRLSAAMDWAFRNETDRVLPIYCYDTFKEWMLQLRIGKCQAGGIVRPGQLCSWWMDNMEPTKRTDTAYAACLQLRQALKGKAAR